MIEEKTPWNESEQDICDELGSGKNTARLFEDDDPESEDYDFGRPDKAVRSRILEALGNRPITAIGSRPADWLAHELLPEPPRGCPPRQPFITSTFINLGIMTTA